MNVIVPSARELRSIPLIDQVPSAAIVATNGVVMFVPSWAISVIVAPGSPIPSTVTFVTLTELIGSVANTIATSGATVSFVEITLLEPVWPVVPTALAVKVIEPSFSAVRSRPAIDQVPSPATIATTGEVPFDVSLATRVIVAPTSPLPLTVILLAFAALMGPVTEVIVTGPAGLAIKCSVKPLLPDETVPSLALTSPLLSKSTMFHTGVTPMAGDKFFRCSVTSLAFTVIWAAEFPKPESPTALPK